MSVDPRQNAWTKSHSATTPVHQTTIPRIRWSDLVLDAVIYCEVVANKTQVTLKTVRIQKSPTAVSEVEEGDDKKRFILAFVPNSKRILGINDLATR